ncbi:DUF6491 family protein [Sphingomonas sp.]|jgi:hypothetical protein|uniref:DUF6491 family protein n=1 Tax=Sphingomonas sp. TaxID=28214 RepID=UPI002E2EC0D0|nr:DUF6491 family protein [Sphingomonas sp.]HEX4694201.1 DUF6491 family protein [Sphingomonas sp.]
MRHPFIPLSLIAISAATLASPALAHKRPPVPVELGKETSIPFIGTIGLYDFEADGHRGVWLQDQRRHWYYATISGVCTGLPFANRIAVDTRFGGTSLDRTGVLLVDGQRCYIDSLVTSAGPPKKVKRPKKG